MNKNTKANQRFFRNQAREVAKFHFPSRRITIKPLTGGLTNFVFAIKAGTEEFVIRMSSEAESMNGFLKEQWAVHKAREKKIPVADILEVGNLVIPYPYMIIEKIKGEPALGHPERKTILGEMGRLTAMIHSIKTKGYGKIFNWTENELDKNLKWKSFLLFEINAMQRIEFLLRSKMINRKIAIGMKKLVREMLGWKTTPHLQHGDMRLKNIMADKKGKIKAVIDWEDAISAIGPWWDLSIALHDLPLDGQQSFLDGYGMSSKRLIESSKFIKVYNLLNYVPAVEQMKANNDRNGLLHYRSRLHGALDLFSI
jgi:hygromycin-B 4-O-kinase